MKISLLKRGTNLDSYPQYPITRLLYYIISIEQLYSVGIHRMNGVHVVQSGNLVADFVAYLQTDTR